MLDKLKFGRNKKKVKDEKYYFASQWTLMWRKLKQHKLAKMSIAILMFLYLQALFGQFIAPYSLESYDSNFNNSPPTRIRFVDNEGKFHLRPFIYGKDVERDPETFRKIYIDNPEKVYPIKFWVEGEPYKFWGIFETNRHLYGIEGDQKVFIFGSDRMGRDMYSRIVLGSQISLFIPLMGVSISFVLGILIGSISGYFGGWIDVVIQRIIEVIRSFPTLPLWMALAAAIPPNIPVVPMFFFITIILSLLSWTGLARVVRSKFISLKTEDFIMAAKVSGVGDFRIILTHMIPGFLSYLVVQMTLSIPGMILGETSMSFLGLGIRSPATSWGVLLQEAQKVQNVALYPWKLIPLIFVVITVLAFNFFGDGLRDAADPYK